MKSDCAELGHTTILTYSRPWRRLFRYTLHIRCADCLAEVIEP